MANRQLHIEIVDERAPNRLQPVEQSAQILDGFSALSFRLNSPEFFPGNRRILRSLHAKSLRDYKIPLHIDAGPPEIVAENTNATSVLYAPRVVLLVEFLVFPAFYARYPILPLLIPPDRS